MINELKIQINMSISGDSFIVGKLRAWWKFAFFYLVFKVLKIIWSVMQFYLDQSSLSSDVYTSPRQLSLGDHICTCKVLDDITSCGKQCLNRLMYIECSPTSCPCKNRYDSYFLECPGSRLHMTIYYFLIPVYRLQSTFCCNKNAIAFSSKTF